MSSQVNLFRTILPQVFRGSSAMQVNVATLAVRKNKFLTRLINAFAGLNSEHHIYSEVETPVQASVDKITGASCHAHNAQKDVEKSCLGCKKTPVR